MRWPAVDCVKSGAGETDMDSGLVKNTERPRPAADVFQVRGRAWVWFRAFAGCQASSSMSPSVTTLHVVLGGGEHLQERVGIELLYVVHAGHHPFPGQEHVGSHHRRHAGGVAHGLRPGLLVGGLYANSCCRCSRSIPCLPCRFLDAAADGGLSPCSSLRGFRGRGERLSGTGWATISFPSYITGSMRAMPMSCITRRWVRYSCPNVIRSVRGVWSGSSARAIQALRGKGDMIRVRRCWDM